MVRDLGGEAASLLRGPVGVFDRTELAGLPEPVASYFRSAISAGSPLAVAVRIQMRGRIRIGRWLRFRAHEVLDPHRGFIWSARAAGVISGSDRFLDGTGAMDWRIMGLLPVMRASGPDVTRSAAGRAAAEAVWVPTSLLPRFGVEWSVGDDGAICARYGLGGEALEVGMLLDDDSMIRSVRFERWGDPDGSGTFGAHIFGGEFTAHGDFGGMRIPTEGRLGWHYGTERWPDGEFFRFRVTDLQPVV